MSSNEEMLDARVYAGKDRFHTMAGCTQGHTMTAKSLGEVLDSHTPCQKCVPLTMSKAWKEARNG